MNLGVAVSGVGKVDVFSRSGWARSRSRGASGWGWSWGLGHLHLTSFTNGSCRMRLTTPWTHHSSIQQRAQCPKWMFGYCLLYYGKALILQPQPPSSVLLIPSLNTFILINHFPVLLLIHLICPFHQPKDLPSFPPSQANPASTTSCSPHHCSQLQYPQAVKDARMI